MTLSSTYHVLLNLNCFFCSYKVIWLVVLYTHLNSHSTIFSVPCFTAYLTLPSLLGTRFSWFPTDDYFIQYQNRHTDNFGKFPISILPKKIKKKQKTKNKIKDRWLPRKHNGPHLSGPSLRQRPLPSSGAVLDVAGGGERDESQDAQGGQGVRHRCWLVVGERGRTCYVLLMTDDWCPDSPHL